MNALTTIPALLLSAISATTCGGAGPAVQGAFGATSNPPGAHENARRPRGEEQVLRWDGPVKSLEVRTMNSPVRAIPSEDGLAHVVARVAKRGPTDLRLHAALRGETTLVCVESSEEANADWHGHDYREQPCNVMDRGGGTVTDLEVRIPKGAKLASWTMNGSVEAQRLENEFEAHTQNGAVRIETTGIARASTVNGSIRAKLGATSWEGTVTLETVNGELDVELPKGVAGKLNADSAQGSVRVGLPLNSARVEETHVEGQLGKGGGELRLHTVNGHIEVR